MRAIAQTEYGAFAVDLDTEDVEPAGDVEAPGSERLHLALPRVVAAASRGSTIVAVVDRKPPLVVSHDAGITWRETGGGLPAGFAVAVDESDPDRILYAARNRLYLSEDGGTFWRRLEPELADIVDLALL